MPFRYAFLLKQMYGVSVMFYFSEPVCAEADHAPYDISNDYPTHTAAVQAEFDSRIQQLIDTTTLHRAPHR